MSTNSNPTPLISEHVIVRFQSGKKCSGRHPMFLLRFHTSQFVLTTVSFFSTYSHSLDQQNPGSHFYVRVGYLCMLNSNLTGGRGEGEGGGGSQCS